MGIFNIRQKRLNKIAAEILLKNEFQAISESKRLGLEGDEKTELFIDAGFKMMRQLVDEHNASIDEAVDAYMKTETGSSINDRKWLKELFMESL